MSHWSLISAKEAEICHLLTVCVATLNEVRCLLAKQRGRMNVTQATTSFCYCASQLTFKSKLNWVMWFCEGRDSIYSILMRSNISGQHFYIALWFTKNLHMYYLFNSCSKWVFCRLHQRTKPAQKSLVPWLKLTSSKRMRQDLNQIWLTPKPMLFFLKIDKQNKVPIQLLLKGVKNKKFLNLG